MLFWEHVGSDLPSFLTEGGYGDPHYPHFSTVPQVPEFNDQMLSQHPAYKQGILVRNTFQSIERKDGENVGPHPSEYVFDPV